MNARLPIPSRRVFTPVATILMVVAVAAALALGFGLRAWTEPAPQPAAPAAVVTQPRPVASEPLLRMGEPR